MKVTDLMVIYDVAIALIDSLQPIALNWIDSEILARILANAYINNDTSKEVTNHVEGAVTIIYTLMGVSLIIDEKATRYKARQPLCLYDNLEDDLAELLSALDFCFQRLEERM